LASDRSLLLPHEQFAFAELKRDGKEQILRLVFATHEIIVRGQCLRRIESAMQRLELASLVSLPIAQRPLVPDGQALVTEIVVVDPNRTS
jgi:hypothetical protein